MMEVGNKALCCFKLVDVFLSTFKLFWTLWTQGPAASSVKSGSHIDAYPCFLPSSLSRRSVDTREALAAALVYYGDGGLVTCLTSKEKCIQREGAGRTIKFC